MTCKPGDLALNPLPYADVSVGKKLPFLLLAGPDRHGDFFALADHPTASL
jgi:hypothetical protein